MCRIGLELTTFAASGLTIESANGRYRKTGFSSWTTFPISLNNPKTPSGLEVGIYELQVNVVDSSGTVSAWSPPLPNPASFKIAESSCTETPDDDPPTCFRYQLTNQSSSSGNLFEIITCTDSEFNNDGDFNGGDVNSINGIPLEETVTFCAVVGPRFSTVIVNVTLSFTSGRGVSTVLVTTRSAC